jgi:AmmeMemoRadiSam system protein A
MRRDAFVTVHIEGKLRGCIGVLDAREDLRETIVHCAQSAALRDARFDPVCAEELDDLQLEISVLSEMTPISPAEVEIGRHGLYITSPEGRGLLLPQVAVEHRLSREAFIEETCRKAGLPPDAWRRPGTQLFAFTCDVFQDSHAGTAGAS